MPVLKPPPHGRPYGSPTSPPRPRLAWRPILLEACFVVLGVVLALAANAWRENRVDRARADAALQSIREELETNRDDVFAAYSYHTALLDTLRALARLPAAGDGGPFPEGSLFSSGFVAPAGVLFTAWDAAVATDAVSHMPYDEVLVLSRTYEEQRRYQRQAAHVSELIYTRLFDEGYGGMLRNYRNLSTILMTLWYNECHLLAHYAETHAALGRPGAVPAPPARCAPVLAGPTEQGASR